jgi:hypothetical protein
MATKEEERMDVMRCFWECGTRFIAATNERCSGNVKNV